MKAQTVKRTGVCARAEALGLQRIREHLAQRAARHIRRASRQIEDLLIAGTGDFAGSPRPQSRQRPKQLRLAGTRRSQDQNPLSRLDYRPALLEPIRRASGYDFEIVYRDDSRIALPINDPAFELLRLVQRHDRMAEDGHAEQGPAPV